MDSSQSDKPDHPGFHDAYIAAWNRATATGEVDELSDYIADSYHGWTGTSGQSLEPFDSDDAWKGFSQAVEALKGAEVRAENRTIGHRGDDEAVVFYELIYALAGEVVARAALLEVWRDSDGHGWKLCRDVTEHSVGPLAQIS